MVSGHARGAGQGLDPAGSAGGEQQRPARGLGRTGAGRDDVVVPAYRLLGRHLHALGLELGADVIVDLLNLLPVAGGAETARTLLVHLGARRHAVDGHIHELAGLDYGEQAV